MFVRWQRREQRQKHPGLRAETHLAAILIESVRVDGNSRQRHIAYLSGITEEKIVGSIGARSRFWRQVDERLQGLPTPLTDLERSRIVSALADKVPRPTKEECQRSAREFQAKFARPQDLSRRRRRDG
jgi:hypothetical protein